MPLQIDASFLYCVPDREPGVVDPAWKELDCPHNTYVHSGLPPTPIAMPGEAALQAAANPITDPAFENSLFYVLCDADGNHCFSNTLDEHNEKVATARAEGVIE